jgi:hypothetical protein
MGSNNLSCHGVHQIATIRYGQKIGPQAGLSKIALFDSAKTTLKMTRMFYRCKIVWRFSVNIDIYDSLQTRWGRLPAVDLLNLPGNEGFSNQNFELACLCMYHTRSLYSLSMSLNNLDHSLL